MALNLNFVDAFDGAMGDAYQRLLLDVAEGNPSLFIHRDEVEQAWAWINPILEAWENQGDRPDAYYSGTWGPHDADELMQRDGREWLQPDMSVSGA